jgi:acetamidase/formamidase
MIALIRRHTGLDDADIYMLCSLAADVRVTQVVNCNKGVRVMLEKSHMEARV